MKNGSPLFEPIKVGDLILPNRVIMAPLTRCHQYGEGRVPTELMAEYYVQRASAGLIITEATSINPMGVGYPRTPGIWSLEQVQGWQRITHRVHQAGGRIFLQLWHVGRISDPHYLHGELPVAPSAIAPQGHVSLMRPKQAFGVPRALENREIPAIVAAYKKASEYAQKAGFDGVEIHGANGYLIDQFLHQGSNQRTDEYGGSIENRARFLLQVTDAVCEVWGKDRVGMHLAPRSDAHGVSDPQGAEVFRYVAKELGKRQIAFICARESLQEPRLGPELKRLFGGVYVANEQFSLESAEKVIEQQEADAVAFGQAFIANPDLPQRFLKRAPLNEADKKTFYMTEEISAAQGDHSGYTDYPFL